jgi:hypothetical protein
MITTNISTLLTIKPVLQHLAQTDMPARESFKTLRILKVIDKEFENIEIVQRNLFNTYGEKDEEDQLVINEDGTVKIKEEMIRQRQIFKEGCQKYNNIDEDTSMKIFDLMEKFANYGFNKSHAACYAWVSYQTAYLKAHYPAEFMAASMTYDMTDADKLSFFAENVKKMGIKILRPDINKSFELCKNIGADILYEPEKIVNSKDNYKCFAIEDYDGNKIEIAYYDK